MRILTHPHPAALSAPHHPSCHTPGRGYGFTRGLVFFVTLMGATRLSLPMAALAAPQPGVTATTSGTAAQAVALPAQPVAAAPAVQAPAAPSLHAKPKRPIAEEHLDSWFQTVSLSYLLSHNADALRRQDVSAGYFVSEQAGGNLVPALKPWRERLRDKGFSFEFTYKGEGMGNVAGGLSKGMDYTHEIRASMLFDLGRLTRWRPLEGWYLHGIVMNREGRQVGWDHVGERNVLLTEVWSIHGPAAARLADLYLEKSFLDNRININIGRIAITHTYSTSVLLCTFMTMCSAPMAIREPAGWSVYPKTSWGGTLRFRPTRDLTIRTGIYRIGPKAQDNTGWAWGSETATGIQTPIELTWEPFIGPQKLPGHYKLGYGHDTSPYPDLIGTIPAAYAGSVARRPDKARDTFYIEADQMVYRSSGQHQMAGGYILAGFVHNTPSNSTFSNEFYFGTSLLGLVPGRPRDRVGVMYSYYQLSPRLTYGQQLREAAGMSMGAYVNAPQTHSAILEAYYGIPVTPGLVVTPEFEYVMRPGETSVIPNAVVAGLKVIAAL